MSYVNRFGAGQIFPQNQQLQQNAQRQMQMMQMQLQLQQKIQSQLQKQYTIKTEAQKRNSELVPEPKNVPAGKGPEQNQPIANQKQVQQNKPNTPNQGQMANQRNVNNTENKNQSQGQNKPQGNKGPDNNNKPNANAGGIKVESKESSKDKPNADISNDRGPKNKPPFQNQKGQQPQTTRPQNSLLGQHPSERLGPPVQDMKNERSSAQFAGQNQRGQQGQSNQYNNQGQGSWQGGQNQNSGKFQSQKQDSGKFQGQNPNSGKFQGQNPNSGKFQGQNQNQGPGNYQQQQNYNRGNPQRNTLAESSKFGGGKPANQNANDYRQVPPNRGGAPQGKIQGRLSYYGMEQVKNKIRAITEPLTDLDPLDMSEKKFNAYAKLFIGNISKNCDQKEITSLFEKYGEIGPVYLNKESSFGFIHMDYKANAGKAMKELDNTSVKNRHLKIRFATINEGLRVKNLSPYVSNELLEKCFSVFGPIESCRVTVDDRGNPKQEGIVIFKDKKSCLLAIKKCQDDCYFLSGAMRPVVVLPLEPSEDNVEGYTEALLPKNEEYTGERNILPHFAERSSFEFEFGMQWKQLFAMYEEKKATLDRDFQIELERLEKKMVLAKVEYETDKLRKELAQREAESAELRRHFDFGENMGPPPSGPSSGGYDSYSGTKRPLDEGYDSTYNGPYEGSYPDGYSRGGGGGGGGGAAAAYSSADYDRGYDQGGYGNYGREDYRGEASGPVAAGASGDPGYGHERVYDNSYERSNDMGPPSRTYDGPVTEGYSSNPDGPGGDLYAGGAPSKRPRY